MKNFFSNIIEKAKDFVTNLTPAAKLRYIVISVLTVAVVASLLVVVALNTGKPETPTNPKDFETGETASIDFDNEIIFGIGDESSSVNTTDDVTDGTTIATDVSSATDEPTSGEESSNVETDNNTETTDEIEPQPTDPSQDYNPDPQPEDTTYVPVINPNPTETTTKQAQTTPKPTETTAKTPQTTPKPSETTTKVPQTNPKPTETTTKQTQTTPKPTETTAKTPQTTPKPTETTTKATQTEPKPTETTKPQENNPQPTGQFSLKEKKYDYNGANVSIVEVENKSQQAYTITITGKFKDSSGKVIKTESKTFEGFPGGWSNYFIFQPDIKYSSVTWGMETNEFNEKTYADYIVFGGNVQCSAGMMTVNENGEFFIPTGIEEFKKCKEVVAVTVSYSPIYNNYSSPLEYNADVVLFDNAGKLCFIGNKKAGNFTGGEADVPYYPTGVLWVNRDDFKIPQHLNDVTGIMAFNSVSEY